MYLVILLQQVNICGSEGRVWTRIGWLHMKFNNVNIEDGSEETVWKTRL